MIADQASIDDEGTSTPASWPRLNTGGHVRVIIPIPPPTSNNDTRRPSLAGEGSGGALARSAQLHPDG